MVNIGVKASIDGQQVHAVYHYKFTNLKYIAEGKNGNLRDNLKQRLKKDYKDARSIEIIDFQIMNTLEKNGLYEAG